MNTIILVAINFTLIPFFYIIQVTILIADVFSIFYFVLHRDGLISVGDAVEAMSGYVDDLWKLGDLVYTEDRMKSFLDIIGDEVVSLVKNTIEEVYNCSELQY